MSAVVVIQQLEFGGGGSDFTPAPLNWGDIASGVSGVADNSATEQTVAGIDNVIMLRASWTSSSANPAKLVAVKNGAGIGAYELSPVTFTVVAGDKIYFSMQVAYTDPNGNYDTGTVTVTNQSDSGATLDTFAFTLQYVPSGGGGEEPLPP